MAALAPITLLQMGVQFGWTGNTTDWKPYGMGLLALTKEVQTALQPALQRQKRMHLTRRDVLTYLELHATASPARRLPEWKLLAELLPSISSGIPYVHALEPFLKIPWLTRLNCEMFYDDGSKGELPFIFSRWDGEPWAKKPAYYPQYFVDLGELRGSPKEFEYFRLLLAWAAVEVRRHVQLYYETGMMHLAKCKRDQCCSWFVPPRMGVRSKFCSSICRVAASREQTD